MFRLRLAAVGAFLLLAAPVVAQTAASSTLVRGSATAPGEAAEPESHSAAVYPDDAPNWLPMADAIAAAKANGHLVLIHSYAVWCGWCRRLDSDTYTDDAVQAYLADHFEVTRLDIESPEEVNFFGGSVPMRELADAFGVSGTPTTVFFDADGNYITKAPSYWPPDKFLLVLRYVTEGAYDMMPFADYVEMMEADQGG